MDLGPPSPICSDPLLGPVPPHQSGQVAEQLSLQEGKSKGKPEIKGGFFFSMRGPGGRKGAAAGGGTSVALRMIELRRIAALQNIGVAPSINRRRSLAAW
jgi:hypothetical protein